MYRYSSSSFWWSILNVFSLFSFVENSDDKCDATSIVSFMTRGGYRSWLCCSPNCSCTLERHRTFVANLFVCPSSGWCCRRKALVHKWSSSSSSCRQCPICLEDFVEGESCRVLVTCKHTFHLICIDAWLKSQLTCPLCRNFVCTTYDFC